MEPRKELSLPRCVDLTRQSCSRPRGGHNTSPSTPSAEPEEPRRLGGPPNPNDVSRPGRLASESLSPRSVFRPTNSDESLHHKRIRVGYDGYSPVPCEPRRVPPPPDVHKPTTAWQPQGLELPRIHEDVLHRPWQPEPYVTKPRAPPTANPPMSFAFTVP